MQIFKRGTILILAVLTVVSTFFMGIMPPVQAATTVDATAALAVDAQTGQILFDQNSKQVLPIASISKMLTVAVIEQEVQEGKLKWNTPVTINQTIADISNNSEFSNVALQVNQKYSVDQLMNATLIRSADGAALALATMNGQTVASFNEKLQAMAKKMGINDAKIYNSVGLDNDDLGTLKLNNVPDEAENAMSARDVAKLATYVIKHDPHVLSITEKTKEQFHSIDGSDVVNTENLNEMLPGNKQALTGYTTDGLKTGTSDAAGDSFVGTGTYKGHRLITVVLHANHDRYVQTSTMLKTVFAEYQPTVLNKTASVKKIMHQKTPTGKQASSQLTLANNETIWLTKKTSLKDWTVTKHVSKAAVTAPFKKNQTVGHLTIGQKKVAFLTSNHNYQAQLVTTEKMAKTNWLVATWRQIFS